MPENKGLSVEVDKNQQVHDTAQKLPASKWLVNTTTCIIFVVSFVVLLAITRAVPYGSCTNYNPSG